MAAAQALRDKIVSTYARIAKLDELEETRGEVFANATASSLEREAEAVNDVADRLCLLVAARVPALNAPKLTPEMKLAAELQLYRREELERLQAIAKHEEATRSARTRLADAEKDLDTISRNVVDLKQQIRQREEGEHREAVALLEEREAAIAFIGAESDDEARRVLAGVAEAVGAARAQEAALCSAELAGAEKAVLDALNTYAATCRLRVKGIAGDLGALAGAQYDMTVKPVLDKLDAAKGANHSAAAQLAATRDRLLRLHSAVLHGRDPGDDISSLASSFPLLPADMGMGGKGGRGQGGPVSPSSQGPSSPPASPSKASAAALSPPASGLKRSSISTTRSPHAEAGSSPGLSGIAIGMSRPRSSSMESGRDRMASSSSSVAAPAPGPSMYSPSNMPILSTSLLDVLGTLETRDAHSLGLTAPKARKELASLIDRTLASWSALDCGSPGAGLAFLRATQAALANGARPQKAVVAGTQPPATPSSQHATRKDVPAVGVDIAGTYKAEAESIGSRAVLSSALGRLQARQAAKAEAQAAALVAQGAAKVDAARVLSAASSALADAQILVDKAVKAFRLRHGQDAPLPPASTPARTGA